MATRMAPQRVFEFLPNFRVKGLFRHELLSLQYEHLLTRLPVAKRFPALDGVGGFASNDRAHRETYPARKPSDGMSKYIAGTPDLFPEGVLVRPPGTVRRSV
jgi:hypothetical protein